MRLLDEVLLRYRGPVAFIDESFELNPSRNSGQFYIIAGAVVDATRIRRLGVDVRKVGGGFVPHASDLWRANKKVELRSAIDWATEEIDQLDVHVFRAQFDEVVTRSEMRAVCLQALIESLHAELRVELFILDSSRDKNIDEQDRRTHLDLKRNRIVGQRSQIFHQWPTEQPLLALPDLVCWAFRQEITGDTKDWALGFRKYSKVFEHRP